MIEWPFYEVEFERGPVITIASAALPSALIDAVTIANDRAESSGLVQDEALNYHLSDVVSVRQIGSVYISEAIEQTLTAARMDDLQARLDAIPDIEDSFFEEEVERSGGNGPG